MLVAFGTRHIVTNGPTESTCEYITRCIVPTAAGALLTWNLAFRSDDDCDTGGGALESIISHRQRHCVCTKGIKALQHLVFAKYGA